MRQNTIQFTNYTDTLGTQFLGCVHNFVGLSCMSVFCSNFNYQAVMMQLSDSHQTVVRLSSGSYQALIRKYSGSYQIGKVEKI